jgi:uncharacterized damage-inducible protein DinB
MVTEWDYTELGGYMTYYGAKELAASFRTVRGNTIKIAEEIPEDKYSFRPSPDSRSVAETLVHIAVMPRIQEQVHFVDHRDTLVGMDFMSIMGSLIAEEKKPRSKAEILELLHTTGEKYAKELEGVTEQLLGERVQMPPAMEGAQSKSRFEMLLAPKEHEMHHRGQLMTAQRLIGLKPHLTRQMEERIAAMQAQMGAKGAH